MKHGEGNDWRALEVVRQSAAAPVGHGVLLNDNKPLSLKVSCSDVPTKVFILSLNEEKAGPEKFVLEDLDDKTLFVQPTVVEWLEGKLKEFQDENTYQVPQK